MQFKIWIDENNTFVINTKLHGSDADDTEYSNEVVSALISESNLTTVDINQALDVLGQATDQLLAVKPQAPIAKEDWREKFRNGA